MSRLTKNIVLSRFLKILRRCESAKKELEKSYTDAENVTKELQTEKTTLKIQVKDLTESFILNRKRRKIHQ